MAEHGRGGLAGGLPAVVKAAAIGLLLHQLSKQRDASAAPAGGGLGDILGGLLGSGGGSGPGQGGGLLDGLLRGGVAAGGGLGGLLGGLSGMLGGLRSQGLAEEVDSWVGTGPNRDVGPDRLKTAFDPRDLDEAARHAGIDPVTLMEGVSKVLPEMVDRMTPDGRLPAGDAQGDAGAFDSLLGSLGLGGGGPRR